MWKNNSIWNSGLINIDNVVVRVSENLVKKMHYLHNEYPSIEVGGYIKYIQKVEGNTLVFEVPPEIYIPEQTCTAGSIKFEEPPPKGWGGVIHKHPPGVTSFSSTDEEFINANFDLSLLYEPQHGITDGMVRLTLKEDMKLRVKPKIEIKTETVQFEIPKEKIKNALPKYKYNYNYLGKYMTAPTFQLELTKRGFKMVRAKEWVKITKRGKIVVSEYRPGEVMIELKRNRGGEEGIEDVFITDYEDALNYIDLYISDTAL
jgi:hypothetical protein